jgi:hypothetical protein
VNPFPAIGTRHAQGMRTNKPQHRVSWPSTSLLVFSQSRSITSPTIISQSLGPSSRSHSRRPSLSQSPQVHHPPGHFVRLVSHAFAQSSHRGSHRNISLRNAPIHCCAPAIFTNPTTFNCRSFCHDFISLSNLLIHRKRIPKLRFELVPEPLPIWDDF